MHAKHVAKLRRRIVVKSKSARPKTVRQRLAKIALVLDRMKPGPNGYTRKQMMKLESFEVQFKKICKELDAHVELIYMPWPIWKIGDNFIGRSRGTKGDSYKFLVLEANFKNRRLSKKITGKLIAIRDVRFDSDNLPLGGKFIKIELTDIVKIPVGIYAGMDYWKIDVSEVEVENKTARNK